MSVVTNQEVSIPRGEVIDSTSKSFFDQDHGLLNIAYAIFPSLYPKLTGVKLLAKDALNETTDDPNIKYVQDLCKKLNYDGKLDIYQGRNFKTHGGSFSFGPHVLILPDKNTTHVDEFLLAKQIINLKHAKGLKSVFWTYMGFEFIFSLPLYLLNLSAKMYFAAMFTGVTGTIIFCLNLSSEDLKESIELKKAFIPLHILLTLIQTVHSIRRDAFENDRDAAEAIGFDRAIKALKELEQQDLATYDKPALSILSLFAFEWKNQSYNLNHFIGPSYEKRITNLQDIKLNEVKV